MSVRLRLNFAFWLGALVILQAVVQIGLFVLYEWYEIRHVPGTSPSNEMDEVLVQVGVSLVATPVVLGGIWYISRRMLLPLRNIAETAQRISLGQLDDRIPVASDDELGLLVRSLNTAFDRYRDAVSRLQRFTSNASHQLRTPLTAIRSGGEVCLHKDRTPEEYREAIASMLEDAARLSKVVEGLLALSHLDSDRIRKRFQPLDLAAAVETVVTQFDPLAQDKCILLEQALTAGVFVGGDEELLRQVAANLVDNAIRHTPPRGSIRISVSGEFPSSAVLTVADSGSGIPPEFVDRIFERFVRLPGTGGEGMGLGLAIVNDIVSLHDGRIEVATGPAGGAQFRVILPRLAHPEKAAT